MDHADNLCFFRNILREAIKKHPRHIGNMAVHRTPTKKCLHPNICWDLDCPRCGKSCSLQISLSQTEPAHSLVGEDMPVINIEDNPPKVYLQTLDSESLRARGVFRLLHYIKSSMVFWSMLKQVSSLPSEERTHTSKDRRLLKQDKYKRGPRNAQYSFPRRLIKEKPLSQEMP